MQTPLQRYDPKVLSTCCSVPLLHCVRSRQPPSDLLRVEHSHVKREMTLLFSVLWIVSCQQLQVDHRVVKL